MTEDLRTDDAALAKRIATGDLTAFEEVYRVHASRLYSLAWRMLGNSADAEDAVQDVFLQAYRRIGSYKGEAALGTWLYRLAMNVYLDRLRSRSSRERQKTDSLDDPPHAQPVAARRELTLQPA